MAQRATPFPVGDPPASDKITIYQDGTWSPPSVTINNGGIVNFDVPNYPPGMNTCSVTIGSVTFSFTPDSTETPGGTIKVGS
jgi:hypothetical protein